MQVKGTPVTRRQFLNTAEQRLQQLLMWVHWPCRPLRSWIFINLCATVPPCRPPSSTV